jgi:hypothetical protein
MLHVFALRVRIAACANIKIERKNNYDEFLVMLTFFF